MKFEVRKTGYDEYDVRIADNSKTKIKKSLFIATGIASIASIFVTTLKNRQTQIKK